MREARPGRSQVDVPGEWADLAACLRLPLEPAPLFELYKAVVNFDGTPAAPQEPTKRDFFPPEGQDVPTGRAAIAARVAATARAVKVCAACPVTRECRRWAYANDLCADHDGILGGETPQQRRNNRRKTP